MTPEDQIYSVPTTVGAAKLAYAMANELTVKISHMALGDGNGQLVEPASNWPALAREVHRAQLNQLYQHPDNPNWLVAELVLPAEVGGWTIREIALYDVDGDIIFIGNHAEQYKPVQSQGSDETKTIRMVILVSDVATVTLKTDPTTVMATIDYVQRELAKLDHKQSVRYTTTAAVVLSGLGVQAGGDWVAALTAGDRVLVKNQASAKDNGIYVVAGGVWVRSADADISAEVTPGLVVAVELGAALADTRWQLVTDGAIVLGTTALIFQDVTKGYAPLASPEFTGDPRAPTPAQFEIGTSIATMEAIQRALGSGFRGNLALSGAAITLTPAQVGYRINATTTVLNLPQASTVPIGASFNVSFAGGACTVNAFAGDTLASGSLLSLAASAVFNHASFATITKITATAWLITGSAALRYEEQFSASAAPNGWMKHPCGLIKQWGNSLASTAGVPVVFPVAFPNQVFTVIPGAASGTGVPYSLSQTQSGFTYYATAGAAASHYWEAFGR